MSSSDARSRRRALRPARGLARRAGFTLIEVLAAVALLGILYAVLARVAIEGLRAEGDSERRLQASLIADEHVNDLVGAPAPPVGHSETTEGDFALALDVSPFVLPTQWGVGAESAAPPMLLASAPGANGGVQALRTVQLTVAWLEGGSERHVSRTLFLLDFQAVAQLATAAAQAGASNNNGELPLQPTPEQMSNEAPPPAPEEEQQP